MTQTKADRDLIDRIQIRQTETAIAAGYRVAPEMLAEYEAAKKRQGTMTQTTNWESCFIANFTGNGPAIEVKDDCETYCASIPEGLTVSEMCALFARTYDFNGEIGSVSCSWSEYADAGESWDLVNGGCFRVEAYTEPCADGSTGFAEMC